MKLSRALKAFLDDAKATDNYWVEHAKLEFSIALERQRRAAGLTYSALAKKIGTSAAYISKVFRGDSNVTIESMVKLARATGGEVQISIVDRTVEARVWHVSQSRTAKPISSATATGSTVVAFPTLTRAANHDAYDWSQVAAKAA